MTSPLSATAQIDASYTPPVPDGLATGSRRIFQAYVDARALVAASQIAYLSWNGELSMVSGGANNNFTLTIGAINAVVLYASSTYKVFAYAGGTITQAEIQGGGGTLGSSAAWWYVYTYNNGGSIDFEISSTPPNASRTLKTGDATRVYLGCFRTNTSGAPMAFRAARGQYVYRSVQATLSGASVGSATTIIARPAGTTEVPLVPPHGRIATLEVAVASSATAGDNASITLYSNADSATPETALSATVAELDTTSYTARFRLDLELDSSQQLRYHFTQTGVGSPALTINVLGWKE